MIQLYKFFQKKLWLLLGVCMVLSVVPRMLGQTLLTESFNYPNSTALTSANWTQFATATPVISTSTGNLAYPGTIGNGIGNKVSLGKEGQDVYRTFATATLGNTGTNVPAVYASAVVNISSAQNVLGAGDYFLSLGVTTTVSAKVYIRLNGMSSFSFGLQKGSTGAVEYESVVRPYNTNINIVLKYEWVAGSNNDVLRLYVNPSLAAEPSTADVSYTTTGALFTATDPTTLAAVQLSQGTNTISPELAIDNINVGTTWASVTSPAYDYGDLPVSYDTSKDNVFIPAVHAPLSGLYMGSNAPDLEFGPYSVTSPDENNASGDNANATADEDGIVPASNPIRKGAPYTLSVPVNNPSATTRYLYGWIDFNGDGKFQATELASSTVVSFSNNGSSTQTLIWTSAQTATLTSTAKVYMRLRLSAISLLDTSDATLDERSIGNGAISSASSVDAATYAAGEVEDYQINVVDTYDFGDAPTSYDNDMNGTAAANYKPARNLPTSNLYLGSTYTVENAPLSVAAGADNNGSNGDGVSDDGLSASQLNIRTNVINSYTVNVKNTTGANATLYAWLDLNNNGRFESGELAGNSGAVNVAANATSVTIGFTAAQINTIAASTQKVYLRLRLIQANPLSAIGDAANAVVDERAIADGTSTGAYQYASYGEVEDYQLTVTRDFGDAPVSYENGSSSTAASQTNDPAGTSTFMMGNTIDFELSPASVSSPADNNGTNGDGLDEDAITTPKTITSGAPFTISIPVNNKTAVTKTAYVYGWLDLNGDGKFSGDESVTATAANIAANGTSNFILTWNTTTVSASVLAAGKAYVRFRLSDTSLTNSNAATLIDTRSYGAGTGDGEIEDYQFVVNDLYDYGDAPSSYDNDKDGTAATNYKPARNVPTSNLYLGSTYTVESAPLSVAAGANNNGSNGDGVSDDGLSASQLNIRTNVINNYTVNVKNTTTANATLYAWLDLNNNGRFEAGELAGNSGAVNVAPNATSVTIGFTAAQMNTIAASTQKVYLRLRLIQANPLSSIGDNTGNAVVDERAIADGTSTGAYQYASFGEVEDYQLTVTRDFGDAPVSYESGSTSTAASQTNDATGLASFTMGNTIDFELSPASVTSPADNNGTNGDGADEDAITTPQTITSGAPFTISIPVNNKTAAAKYAYVYGWLDLNGDGKFSGDEAGTASTTPYLGATNGTSNITLTWNNTNASSAVIASGKTYVRFRLSDALLTNANNATQTMIDTRSYGAATGDGEIEDYQFVVSTLYDYGDAPLSYDKPNGTTQVSARNISASTLYLGTQPDEESSASSVAAGADNNGSNGDGLDEDGIDPAVNHIKVATAYSLVVKVTNTSGSAKTLYGWLDINSNGIFEAGEVMSASVANNTSNGTVTLTWPSTTTVNITSTKIYLRLRLCSSLSAGSLAYDTRAIGDGLTTGVYGTSTIGEIEDYQITVNPGFDFGDAPATFEMNGASTSVSVPARHQTASNLYLGSSYDLEMANQPVAASADSNGTNGDGADEDGITATLPAFGPTTTSYSVNVNVYKTIAGTATLHGWIDMDGNGKFSVYEYTSATVTGTAGAQNVTLTWASPFYESTANTKTYMRLRFTTASLADDDSTSGVDERAIGDGLSTGTYTTSTAFANGEIEDYSLPVSGYIDSDGDGITDNIDLDDDNDGILDCVENGITNDPNDAFKIGGNANVPTSNVGSPTGPSYQIQLTPNTNSQAGRAWTFGQIDFSKSFAFTMKVYLGSNSNGADGMAVVFHNSSAGYNAIGDSGGGLGAKYIANGVALELDTYSNSGAPDYDPSYDHGTIRKTSDWSALSSTAQLSATSGNVKDGKWHEVSFYWSVATHTLRYTFDGHDVTSYTFPATGTNSITGIFGGTKAYFGYTASTGLYTNDQRIAFDNPCTIPLSTDTDGDGILNSLDLDSDNDGCLDAIEGDENVRASMLVASASTLSVGTGSSASNQNLGTTVDTQGIPTVVNNGGAADVGGDQGQGIGYSQNSTINACNDIDGDGVPDINDLDNDNDGILDADEDCISTTTITLGRTTTSNATFSVVGGDGSVNPVTSGYTYWIGQSSQDESILYTFPYPVYSLQIPQTINISGTSTASELLEVYINGSLYPITSSMVTGLSATSYITSSGAIGSTNDGTVNFTSIAINYPQGINSIRIRNNPNGYSGNGWEMNAVKLLSRSTCNADYDNDGIRNSLDLDSDNDGCLDAIEGDENVTGSMLVNAYTGLSVGAGSTASNQNLCAGSGCVDSQGVPTIVNAGGAADIGNDQGQGVGTSKDSTQKDPACTSACYKPAAIGGTTLDTKHGITALGRAGTTNNDWPMARKGAWTALESKEKGFVINRVDTTADLSNITNPIEGMMVYDKQAACLKVYTTKAGDSSPAWHCMNTPACPD